MASKFCVRHTHRAQAAEKPQEYFVYFKVLTTQADTKFAVRRVRGFIQRFLSDHFNDFIVSNCNQVDDVVEGFPNRHGAAHSWYKKYPNKKICAKRNTTYRFHYSS